MVPPWVPDPAPAPNSEPDASPDAAPDQTPAPSATPSPVAPAGRFGGARLSLGRFAQSGNENALRQGLGRYVRGGYGGAATTARRFGGTARTANALFGALGGVPGGAITATGQPLDTEPLRGRTAQEVIDAVIEAVRPVDGTQDGEAARAALGDALSELLKQDPGLDLLNLTQEQRELAVERYVAIDVYRRFDLDLGKHIRGKAPSATVALSRLKQAKQYIKQSVAASFRKLRDAGRTMTGGGVSRVVKSALEEAFRVFEVYAE